VAKRDTPASNNLSSLLHPLPPQQRTPLRSLSLLPPQQGPPIRLVSPLPPHKKCLAAWSAYSKTMVKARGGATQGQATGHAAGGAAAAQAHAPVTIVIPVEIRITETARHAFRATLLAATPGPDTSRACALTQLFEYAVSDQPAYGMIPEIQEFVKLVYDMLEAGTLTRGGNGPTDLYHLMSKSKFLRLEKIATSKLLQEYGLSGDFLDAWNPEEPEDAGEAYPAQVGKHRLEKHGNVSFASIFASLHSARVVWGEGVNAQEFTLPPNFNLESTSDNGFFPEAVTQQLPPLVNATVPDFRGSETHVRSWAHANGRTKRLYVIYHGNRIVAYLYQNQMRCGTLTMSFIQAYGVLEEYQGLGLGSAMMYQALRDMRRFKYILADIDRQHPGSLVCFRRAAGVHDRNMEALGRYVAASDSFDLNRRPRKGETTRWCLRLKNAPELFPGRLPRRQWPRTANEEDVSATMSEEEVAVVETEEQEEEEKEEEEEVEEGVQPKPKRSRGGQRKRVQYQKKTQTK